MLIKRAVLEKIITGDVDRAFRRWKRPTVRSGGRLRTAVGELAIQEVDHVSITSLTDEDARRAGYDRLEDLRSELARQPDRDLYRIILRYHDADRRELLRQDDNISDAECASILDQINRTGAKAAISGLPLKILTWIEKWPERRASDLADEIGLDTRKLKAHVRKLKKMGLTESRQTGYCLSARGRRILDVAKKNSAS